MVLIRIAGSPCDIDAATEQISRVMLVTQAGPKKQAHDGGAFRDIRATPDPVECVHPVGEAVRRGQTQVMGESAYLVEYGLCVECRVRLVRVRVEAAGALVSIGAWSELTEVSPT